MKKKLTVHGVIFTDRNEETTEHSAHLTAEDAAAAGAALARERWDAYSHEDDEVEVFPEVDDDWDAMDMLRTSYDVRLEVEEIEISEDVVRALFLRL